MRFELFKRYSKVKKAILTLGAVLMLTTIFPLTNVWAVEADYKINGSVFIDSPKGKASEYNGVRESDEEGLNDIEVSLVGNGVSITTKTSTINDVTGSYEFNGLKAGYYTITFTYNGYTYSAYSMVDENDNSLTYTEADSYDEFTVKGDGAYCNGKKISDVTTLKEAHNSNDFTSVAKRNFNLSQNVGLDFGLIYGNTADCAVYYDIITAVINGDDKYVYDKRAANGEAFEINASKGDKLQLIYELRCLNQSSVQMKNAKIVCYIPFDTEYAWISDTSNNENKIDAPFYKTKIIDGVKWNGYVIDISEVLNNNSSHYSYLTFSTSFDSDGDVKLLSYAEMIEYTFSEGVFDYDSEPNNLTESDRWSNGPLEDDESKSPISIINTGKVKLISANFPDDIFREYVSGFDTDNDGYLSKNECSEPERIYVNNMDIESLKGIEYFTDIFYLYCSNNYLTSLDVSKNVYLERLECYGNYLTSLDLSNNDRLELLSVSGLLYMGGYNVGDVVGSYSLSNLEQFGFDSSKASDWSGARYNPDNNTLTDFTSNKVTYKYDCGNGFVDLFGFQVRSYKNEIKSPTITKAIAGDSKVALNWTAVDSAEKYAIYTYLNGKYTCIGGRAASVTGMYVTGLTNGTKYGFLVRAYINGAWSSFTADDIVYATPAASAAASDISLDETYYGAPVII